MTRSPETRVWGILDTETNLWLGTNDAGDGPKTFTDFKLAELAVEAFRFRLKYPKLRLMAAVIGDEPRTKHDVIPFVRLGDAALRHLGLGEVRP